MEASQTRRVVESARAIGFELCGVAPAEEFEELRRLPEWLERGYAGEMRYLHDARRASAETVLPGARSVIVCALNYNAPHPRSTVKDDAGAAVHDEAKSRGPRGWISRYAWGDDYHDVMKRKLDELAAWMRAEFGGAFQARAYVDTGPVLERVAAKYAGLGWLAKNTCLIHQRLGSWLFLGVILTDLELAPSLPRGETPPDLCGSCRRCRPAMGNMVFGCDICQDVCPWNRKAPVTRIAEFLPRTIRENNGGTGAGQDHARRETADESLFAPALEWLISLNEEEFRKVFRGSPVKRTKWRGLIRNACVAVGNSQLAPENPAYGRVAARLEQLAASEDALIAEHARWALLRLGVKRSDAHRAD